MRRQRRGADGGRRLLVEMFGAAIAALDPTRLVRRTVGWRRGTLWVRDGRPVHRLPARQGVVVVGAGKGAAALALALEERLGAAVVAGLVIVPPGHERSLERITVARGSHPLPDHRSVAATARLFATLDRFADAAVLCVLTGGASSLLVAPAGGVTLAAKRRTTALLLASGATIDEVNTVRKHLSTVKGGGLAERLAGRPAIALVVSDVPGDDLSVIGGGPTVADPTTVADARAVLARYGLAKRVPASVRCHLAPGRGGAAARTPKARARPRAGIATVLLATNATARAGAAATGRARGFRVIDVRRPITGETTQAARAFAARLLAQHASLRGARRALIVAGGETTASLGSRPGRGGRNQEFALEVGRILAERAGWLLLSAGSDGIDGNTDAAGAFADGATVTRAARSADPALAPAIRTGGRAGRAGGQTRRVRGVRRSAISAALTRHDTYPLLAAMGDLFVPGPTGTNVADLKLALVWREQ